MSRRAKVPVKAALLGASVLASAAGAGPEAADGIVTHEVTSTADGGPGSLRAALEAAAVTVEADRIVFGGANGTFSTPRTIELTAPLPAIRDEVTVDGHIEGLLWKAYGATVSGRGRHAVFEVALGATLRLAGITVAEGRAHAGAAVFNRGRLVLEGVTLLGNSAADAGGAIANEGGQVFLINSTAVDNRAARGGAVANLSGDLRITNSTLYRNTAEHGAAVFSKADLEMANSILAGEAREQCVNTGPLSPASTHNLITSHSGCGEPVLEVDPMLGRFGHYNGPTRVFTLAAGSPVINLGENAAAVDAHGVPLVWDQRGNGDPRFAAGFTDLGSFEQQAPLASEFVVDAVVDNGLRGCNPAVAGDCPLRAALELAAVARRPTPVRFDPAVFSDATTIRLGPLVGESESVLFLDGSHAGAVTIVVPGRTPPWHTENGVVVRSEAPGPAGGELP